MNNVLPVTVTLCAGSDKGCMGITELDGEIIREFLEKIIVYKAEKVDGARTQRIQIIYNSLGAAEIPRMQKNPA